MNARDAALLALDASHRLPNWRGGSIGKRRAADLDPRDRALAEQIHVGVMKNVLLLQRLIEHHSGRRLNKIDELTQKFLAIGLYQLRFLDRIPPSAAVNEAVEQTRRFGRTKASAFVNAVLRNALRNDDPSMDDSARWSHPRDVIDRARPLVAGDELLAFLRHNNSEPALTIRLIGETTIDQLADPSVVITPHEQRGMFVVEGAKASLLAEWSHRGLAQPQDPTSALVVDHLDIVGEGVFNVLDRCAGLGTKTLQIAERLGPQGAIAGIDPNRARCDGLLKTANDRGMLANVSAYCHSWMRELPNADRMLSKFDRILIDAPCSNSGVLARRPEARFAQDGETLASLGKLQREILTDTAPFVRPGGLIVYSTCSIWPEENAGLIAEFLESDDRFQLTRDVLTFPSLRPDPKTYRDGGYAAVMRRRS